MMLEKDLAIAQERLRTARNMLGHAQLMLKRGYVSQLEVEQKEFAVKEAELDVEINQTDIDVLKRFTKEQELATLKGDWESAKAAANGHEEVLKMDEARIALARKEIERSVIKAERSGLVIYPMGEEWKDAPEITEGATVHDDQVLLLMPDLSKMQVKVGIYESMVDHIKPGMTARVTMPDRTLRGEVSKVASVAQPAGWWAGNIVKYDAIIQLPAVEGLKPGMSAEVEIVMDRHENVLMIPLAAVVENEQGSFCWVGTPDQAQRRSLALGDSGDTFIVVEEGLQEGEQVVLNPAAFIEETQTRSSAAPHSFFLESD
jgi:multidrug efflux pump subunit AcrA (membrane-fusion protein)